MLSALNLLSRRRETLSQLAADLRRYHATGEINFRVEDKDAAIAALRREFADGQQDQLDGITVRYGDLDDPDWWWFNVRPSNTEPLLRLNLEARSEDTRDLRREQLVRLLGQPEE